MVITLISDFGDFYPASMKGVILSIHPQAQIVDISHNVPRHDIRAGAFMLMTTAKYFPSNTVHIAVVDPGVGTERRAIAIKSQSNSRTHYFVGPDNGVLIPAAKSIGRFEVYEITCMRENNISSTFHGRDIFAPVGAYLSKGMNINEVGKQVYDFVNLDFGEGKKRNKALHGRVIFIDSFGNIITNIPKAIIDFQIGDVLELQEKELTFQRSYASCRKGEALALIGSHDYLEIAINQGNASLFFNKKHGDEIIIRKL